MSGSTPKKVETGGLFSAYVRYVFDLRNFRGIVSAYAEASADTFSPSAKKWWTRSQSIRTAGEVQFAVKLLDTVDVPGYQRIASMAMQLKRLGFSMARVARTLDVSHKTAAKAIKWLEVSQSNRRD